MKVRDILANKAPGVITTTPNETLQAASEQLAKHNIGVLIVVDAAGHPTGILSERDIVRTLAQQGADALAHEVNSAMTKDPLIALPDDEIASLSNTMTAKRIRHLPIMDNDTLVGIVSIGDIVKAQLSHFKGEVRALEQYITGGYA